MTEPRAIRPACSDLRAIVEQGTTIVVGGARLAPGRPRLAVRLPPRRALRRSRVRRRRRPRRCDGAARRPPSRRARRSGGDAVPQIVVDDTRRRLGPIAAEVAGHPSRPSRPSASPAPTARPPRRTAGGDLRSRRRPVRCRRHAARRPHHPGGARAAVDAARVRRGRPRRPRCSRCRRTPWRCTASTAPSSTPSCSRTSATTTSTCTGRKRSTSGPRPGCSRSVVRRSGCDQRRRPLRPPASPTPQRQRRRDSEFRSSPTHRTTSPTSR